MSGKISHGVLGLCSPRKPHIAMVTTVARKKIRKKPRSISILLVHNGDVHPASVCQQIVCFYFAETGIARFNGKEKTVVSDTAETLPVKHWMIPTRQPIHDLPGEKGGESAEKNCQFEHDREKRGHDFPIPRFAMDDQPVKAPRWAEFD